MPNDYYANKVVFGDTTIMDISDTTASPEDVAEGEIFYAANGARSVGTGAGGGYVLPIASAEVLGGVKVGSNLSIDNEGVLSAESGYVLPTASNNTLGGVKVGTNLSIDNNGVLSAENTEYSEGDGIDIEGTTIALDMDYLTASRLGLGTAAIKNVGESEGVAALDENGKVPNSQLDVTEAIDISSSNYDTLPIEEKNNPLKIYFVGEEGSGLIPIGWDGLTCISGDNVWTDGTNIYYSDGNAQYRLNGTTWESVTWTGLTSFYGSNVWTDGTNIYYSHYSAQYKLNGTTWETMTWTGLTNYFGASVWTDGTDIYYSLYNQQYKLNGTTWESMTWNISSISGALIWSDGTNTYYSSGSNQYKLNGTTWESITWLGLTNFSGNNIWTDGTNIYYSYSYDNAQYKLNGTTWESMTWTGFNNILGNYIWTDGIDYYYSNGNVNTKLNGTNWSPMAWSGIAVFDGDDVWTDGTNIYYSDYDKHYKLNGTTWESVTWSGLSDFYGNRVWTDGVNIYCSSYSDQYKLNGNTWEEITWTGSLQYLNGSNIWTDGTNIYYSYDDEQYKLNGTTWESVTWSGLTNFEGCYIWTDGTNIYYSYSYDNAQYKLNGTTWESMTWTGFNDILGDYVWTDGTDIYYSYSTSQYKLNGTTWEPITWTGFNDILGCFVWTNGINYYYSCGSTQYRIITSSSDGGIYYKNNNYVKPSYELPTASANTLGGVKVGSGLSIDANGVLSSAGGGGGTTYTAGDGIDIENTTISLDMEYLTASRLGVIPTSQKGVGNGVATLGADGKIPSSQLPSSSWGDIGGTLSNQTDLQSALNSKQNVNLTVPLEMLSGTKLTVESALGGLNQEKTTAIRLTQAQYNALTNEQKHDTSKVYYITDGQSGGGSGYYHVYSTQEQIVGVWINGKPIYEITLQNSEMSKDIDVSYLNIETLIKMDALGADGSADVVSGSPISGNRFTIVGTSGRDSRQVYVNSSNHAIRDGSFYVGAILLQYTKTTD